MSLRRLRATRAIDVPSALVASVLTVAAFAAVLVVSARTLLFQSESPRVKSVNAQETLVYLERPRLEPPSALRSSQVAPALPAGTTPRVQPKRIADTSAAPPTIVKSSAIAEPTALFLPRIRPQSRSTPSPFDVPRARNPFLSEEPRTRAEMDSILTEVGHGIPIFAKTRTPPAAERDSQIREQSREKVIPGRTAQMPGTAQGSIGLPLFSSGPSAAERRRDSSANAEYVARLRRLQARVSAGRESLRVADSMSRRRTP